MRWLYQILLPFCLTSCLVVPVPHHTQPGRMAIQPEQYSFIQNNKTKREDVLFQLGDPDGVALQGNVFIYHWTMVVAWAAVSGGGGLAASGDVTREEFFLVGFNENHTVKRVEAFNYNIDKHKKPLYQFIKDWYENK